MSIVDAAAPISSDQTQVTAPIDVAAIANDGSVELSWSLVSGATTYAVKEAQKAAVLIRL